MKTEQYEVTVNETKEQKTFDTLPEVKTWVEQVIHTLGIFGGMPTFQCVKHTYQNINL